MFPPVTSIIALVGPTAVGKTKLGVQLAKSLQSEVISIDSLQCYKDGSIISAKVKPEEADGIVHHLVDYVDAQDEPHTFINDAIDCIRDIHSRGRVPILVGGSTSLTIPILQAAVEDGKTPFIIILGDTPSSLETRIRKRVDEMVQEGLLRELFGLYKLEKALLEGPDFSRGVWKVIGYREFYPCFTMPRMDREQFSELMAQCLARLKTETVIYANKQVDWACDTLIPFLQTMKIPHMRLQVDGQTAGENVMAKATRSCASALQDNLELL